MLSEDEYEKVAAEATNGLQLLYWLYSEKCETDYGKSLLDILEDNFYNLVTKLPRILHGTGQYICKKLSCLAGYLPLEEI